MLLDVIVLNILTSSFIVNSQSGLPIFTGEHTFSSRFINETKTQDDPICRKPVIDKAVKLFDFKCSTDLHDGLKKLWYYFSEK